MVKLNSHFKKLKRTYIFSIIEQKLEELQAKQGSVNIINLGIGDIALPLAPSIAKAISDATLEMTTASGLRGYGPSEGYMFLREAIAKHQYAPYGIGPEEIFISDGINTDCVNIQELFSLRSSVAIPDPTYPAYLDSNVMAGRSKIVRLPCIEKNHFSPVPPAEHCDVIYLCTPNNPTGVAMSRAQLKAWVDYAHREKALLLIDNAYEAFVTSPDIPRSIYEIAGAKEVAVEFRSFSKSAGFTGLRCAYTVLPKSVAEGKLFPLWKRRQAAKTNGVAYPIQRGAEAVFSPLGKQETEAQVASYLSQAHALKEGLSRLGFSCFGGTDSPYIWWKVPSDMTSWEFFDQLLKTCHLISIPGSGFGPSGEGYVRLSAFTTPDKVNLTLDRLQTLCLQR